MGAKKQGKKGRTRYSFCHFYEYYLNKLGKFKQPNHVVKAEPEVNPRTGLQTTSYR